MIHSQDNLYLTYSKILVAFVILYGLSFGLSLRKHKVFALQILQRYLTKEGRVRKFFDCLYG